jgi:hypothetical protein
MASHVAIRSLSQSLRRFLEQRYLMAGLQPQVTFQAIGTGWFSGVEEPVADPLITLLLHRMTPAAHGRQSRTSAAPGPVVLDLHFLLTIWTSNVEHEHRLMGWAMQQLHYHQTFDNTVLSSDGGWRADESVSLFPAEMNPDEMARIWESSRRALRLSWPFVVRMVRLEVPGQPEGPPVVATRYEYSQV